MAEYTVKSAPWGSPQKPAVGTVEDVARSGAAGVGRGIIGLPGLPGDLTRMDPISQALGITVSPEQRAEMERLGLIPKEGSGITLNLPTSSDIIGAASDAIRPSPSLKDVITGQKPQTFLEYEPQTTAGEYAQTVGEFAPSMLAPGRMLPKVGAWLGGAGASETAGQLTEGSPWEPWVRFGAGILGGGLLHGLGRYAGTRAPAGQTRSSTAALNDALPEDMTAYDALGPEARVYNASPSMTGLAQGVSVAPGTAKNALTADLLEQQQGRSRRLIDDKNAAMGNVRDPELLKPEIDQVARQQTDPMYADLKRNAQPLPAHRANNLMARLQSFNDRLSMDGRRVLDHEMRQVDDAIQAGQPELVASRLHDMRQRLDEQIVWDPRERAMLGPGARADNANLVRARREVDDILKQDFGFTQADDILSRAKREQGDIDYGRDALEGGKYASTPERFVEDTRRRSMPHVRTGMSADVGNAMGTQANDLPALRKKVGGEYDYNRAKINHAFGPQATERLTNAVGREERFSQDYADINRNSQTAQRLGGVRAVEGSDYVPTSLVELGGRTFKGLVNRFRVNASQSTRDALVQALMTRGPQGRQLMEAVRNARGPAISRVAQALLAIQSTTKERLKAGGPR
jgi:hypothetical protein